MILCLSINRDQELPITTWLIVRGTVCELNFFRQEQYQSSYSSNSARKTLHVKIFQPILHPDYSETLN